ncbi:hypothetical protein F3J44_21225 [Pantoea sp. Tr-811]|uniref:hypothetical protein n=1 Tax=Pantoea sp. Tr-811 TaxID=2608361 RepID=UPI001423BB6B|nr:hypothetical protein [Pantoea sp. Tr-811]NIF28889.1 hypothetical protein [Pantoea sp. Tr-811]
MPLRRVTGASLCLATLVMAGTAVANADSENYKTAVTFLAMEKVCNKAVPGLNGTVDNALANEPMDEALKVEIQAVRSAPGSNIQIDDMAKRLSASPLSALLVEKGTCKVYAAK